MKSAVFDGKRYEGLHRWTKPAGPARAPKQVLGCRHVQRCGVRPPILSKLAFKDLEFPPIHIDLRWVLRRLGYHGGLKSIEPEFGICRDESVDGLDGHEATVLWSRHLRGDHLALQQLIAYNSEDVLHLKAIMEMAYDRLAKQLFVELGERKPLYSGIGDIPKSRLQRRHPSQIQYP